MWLIWHEPLQGLCLPLITSELITLWLVKKFQLDSNVATYLHIKTKELQSNQEKKRGRKGRSFKSPRKGEIEEKL